MFLQYILKRKSDDLLRRFFEAQCRKPSKNDWCLTVKDDIKSLNLDADFQTISNVSKKVLSKSLKTAIKVKAFEDLLYKQEQYSKGSNLSYGELSMRNYLKSEYITGKQAKLIFKFRTRMVQVKQNYKQSNINNVLCPCCHKEEDHQIHLISSKH